VTTPPPLSAEYFDGWYADMARSPVRDEILQRHLGLPPHLLSTGVLGWEGLGEVIAALRLSPGDPLLDLACGRGGYGLEIAARTGARLVGVDFSAEAVRQAGVQARRLEQDADFRVGNLVATGLGAGSFRAVVCVDAMQFAEPTAAACAELRRIVAPGGRVVLTCWEPATKGDPRLPARFRQFDLGAGLRAAGFHDVDLRERAEWNARERAMWEEAAALEPGDDPSLKSFHDEGLELLERFDALRRVMATATAPL
jgi:SAM-dependent methyltransferase